MYEELIMRLKDYSAARKGEIAELTDEAADAIEELNRFKEECEACGSKTQSVIESLQKKIPRWVPVTERLPDKRKWVLCRCEANIIEVLRWENNEWYHDSMHVYYPSFVTHWMPLPKSPKEE